MRLKCHQEMGRPSWPALPTRSASVLNQSESGRRRHCRHGQHRDQQQQQQQQQQQRRHTRGGCERAATICLTLVGLLATPSGAFFIDSRQSPAVSEWNYADQAAWARQHRDCAGRAQSPVDLQQRNVIISQHLKLHFYNYNQAARFKLSNAHHTIKMNPLGAAYEQQQQQQSALFEGQGHGGGPYNSSPIHDIITADEYVKFAAEGQAESSDPANANANANANNNNERLVNLEADAASGQRVAAASGGPQQSRPLGRGQQAAPHSHPNNNHNQNSNHDDNAGHHEEPARASHAAAAAAEPYEGAPTIKLDWLDDGNNEYKLRDIHFHWGERRDNGSEHAIDGRRAAMEMHLVHIKHGLDKSKIGFTSDSVAVIAVLIESHRKSNADFNPIVNELARINTTEQAQLIDYRSIYDLLPSDLDAFYTYSGSLTTPPCYQVVNWIVMDERLNMNAKQIEMFRNLYAPPREDSGHGEDKRDRDRDRDTAGQQQQQQQQQQQHGHLAGRRRDPHKARDQGFQTLSEESAAAAPESDGAESRPALEGEPADQQQQQQPPPQHHREPAETIMPNVRAIQALNNRTILASFTKSGRRLKAAPSHSNSLHAKLDGMFRKLIVCLVSLLVASIVSSSSSSSSAAAATTWARRNHMPIALGE